MRTILSTILIAAACAVLSTPALARGGGGGGGGGGWSGGGHSGGGGWSGGGHSGGWHGGHYGHSHGYYGGWCCGYGVGIYLGAPWYYGSYYYPAYYPAYYEYPAVQYAPVYPQSAPAQGTGSTTPPDYVAPPAGTVQYYCPSGGYYPAVATCPQGWLRVVPH